MNELIFLRPYFLIFLLPLLAGVLFHLKRKNHQTQNFIAPHLLPLFTKKELTKNRHISSLILLVSLFCTVIGLAGPAYKSELPIKPEPDNLVILFGMDRTLYADDVTPSRLVAAKAAVLNIIKQNPEANIALVAFAGTAHLVSPFTNDFETLKFFIDALSPEVMPETGFKPVNAIKLAATLQSQLPANAKTRLLLLADQMTSLQSDRIIEFLHPLHLKMDLLVTGTDKGSVIPLPDGRLLKSPSGQVILAKTPVNLLTGLTTKLGSHLIGLSDIKNYWHQIHISDTAVFKPYQYIDIGSYFFLPLLALALFFRKGHFFLFVICLYQQPRAEAADFSLTSLMNDSYRQVATWLGDPIWQGNAYFRAGDYEKALSAYQKSDSAVAFYNQGNAYAYLQNANKAIEAYSHALLKDPDMKEAKENKAILELWLKQQNPDYEQNVAIETLQNKTKANIEQALLFMRNQSENSGNLLKRRFEMQRQQQLGQ